MERAITSHKTRDIFGHESYSIKRSFLKKEGLLIDVTDKAFVLGLITVQQLSNTVTVFDICITPHVQEECVRWTELDESIRKAGTLKPDRFELVGSDSQTKTTEDERLECLLLSANEEVSFPGVVSGRILASSTYYFKHFWTSRHIYPKCNAPRRLAVHVGPGDSITPVITIMMPSEVNHAS